MLHQKQIEGGFVMEWQLILALVIVIPIILFPVVFIWYMNAGGAFVAIKEARFSVFQPFIRAMRIGLAVIVPLGVYAVAIWLSSSHFGWQVALAVGLVLPIMFLVPILVWATVVSGMYQVARDTLRRRALASWKRAPRTAEEPVTERVA